MLELPQCASLFLLPFFVVLCVDLRGSERTLAGEIAPPRFALFQLQQTCSSFSRHLRFLWIRFNAITIFFFQFLMVFRCCICLLLGLLVERLDFSIEEEAVCLDFGRVLEASGVV
jgi:hypothetical protein